MRDTATVLVFLDGPAEQSEIGNQSRSLVHDIFKKKMKNVAMQHYVQSSYYGALQLLSVVLEEDILRQK